jgi:hypothetical protein
MIWLICFLIIHIISSILAKRVIVNLLEYYGKEKLGIFNDEKVNEYGIKFVKKIMPHVPIINIIFAYMHIKIYILHFLNNKKNKQ